MGLFSVCLKKLEGLGSLLPNIILATKIYKVLKKIGGLDTIPGDAELHFKKRVLSLYGKWKEVLEEAECIPDTSNGNIECATPCPTKATSQAVVIDLTDEFESDESSG
jgi:hypothetical protein